MKAEITNNSRANQGVWSEDGLVHIEPGKTKTVVIAYDFVESTSRLPFLDIVPVGDPLDHDGDGKKGGVFDALPLTDDEKAELFGAMTEDELREFIESRTGTKPHPNSKFDTLVAKAKAAVSADD